MSPARNFKTVSGPGGTLWIAVLCAILVAGCAHKRRGTCCPPNVVQPPAAATSLPIIAYTDRPVIILRGIDEPIAGAPVTSPQPESLRLLTYDECRRLGRTNAPLANQLAQHRDWLASRLGTQHPLVVALAQREEYERAAHAAKAEETLLSLMQIYAVQPLLAESQSLLNESQAIVEKFRATGLPISGDTAELDRQCMRLEQKIEELVYQQQRAIAGLEFLLHVTPDEARPIWGTLDNNPIAELPPLEALLAEPASRGDLQAIETLAAGADQVSPDNFTNLAATTQPLLGAAPNIPASAKLWQCALKQEIECLKQATAEHRRRQLSELADLKRREIALEIREAYHGLARHQRVAELKLREIESLHDSLLAAEAAKDDRPLDFAQHVENRLRLLELAAELVAEQTQVEIYRRRLATARGDSK